MSRKKGVDHRSLVLGCGLLLVVSIIGGIGLLIIAVRLDQQTIRYPGTTALSSRADYQGVPNYVILNDAYLTKDTVGEIHSWYTERFRLNMVAEGTGPSECYVLYGSSIYLAVRRHMGVMICETPSGRTIQVTRSILLERP